MRILIAANNDTGLYKFRKELIEELVKNNEVFFCVPKGDFVEKIKSLGAKFISCDLLDRRGTNPLKDLSLFAFYDKTLKHFQPDVVLTYTIKPNIYCGLACRKHKIPYISNITGLGTAIENGGMLQKISLILYKVGIHNAQMVFFQNIANKDFMINQGIIKGNYDILPGSGINLQQYKLLPYPDRDTIDFVFIARVMKEKGIDQYLDAAVQIRKKNPDTRFHICGICEENYSKRLKKMHDNGDIIYHGFVENMLKVYQIGSCIVHPTYYAEGLSNVLLESAAVGRPIITTDRPGCREIVDDGVNGFIIREQDSADLIKKIEKFLSLNWEQRRNMGLSGRKKVEQNFDRQIVINKYLEEIEKSL